MAQFHGMVIEDNIFEGMQDFALYIYGNNIKVKRNTFQNGSGAIRFFADNPTTGVEIIENTFSNLANVSSIINGRKEDTLVKRNIGFASESNGNAIIPDGQTSVWVRHNLRVTPKLSQIVVTPTNNLGNAMKYWISEVSSSQIRIMVDISPGTTGASFVWSVTSD